ncbi:MAG: helical backbone metal receptor [Bacteroidota bacterium]
MADKIVDKESDSYPSRIVSLVPSQTELLHYLGLGERVCGITKFCVHPSSWFETKLRVGGTKSLHLDKIRSLHPDLILANKEENEKAQIESLSTEFPTWVSEVDGFEQALDMILKIGALTGTTSLANLLTQDIRTAFDRLDETIATEKPIRVAYLIWRNPYMVAAGGTFIDSMIERCGMENVFKNQERYPAVSALEITAADPDLLLLSSEPFPFDEKMLAECRSDFPDRTCLLVDGESFSWYGPRMLHAATYFAKLHATIYGSLSQLRHPLADMKS